MIYYGILQYKFNVNKSTLNGQQSGDLQLVYIHTKQYVESLNHVCKEYLIICRSAHKVSKGNQAQYHKLVRGTGLSAHILTEKTASHVCGPMSPQSSCAEGPQV